MRTKRRPPAPPVQRCSEPHPPERVLALDISSVCVGWSVFDHGSLIDFGKYHPEGPKKHHGARIASFSQWLHDMLRESAPDQLVVEQPYPGRNRDVYRVITMYIGAVLEVHWLHYGGELPESNRIPPQTVKAQMRFPKGVDHADNKRIAVAEINERFDLSLRYDKGDREKIDSDDDIADAIALNQAWHQKHRSDE